MSKIEASKASTAANRGSRFLRLETRKNGGAYRDRTDDLKLAKLALSQLSYGPAPSETGGSSTSSTFVKLGGAAVVGREGVEPSTSRLSGVRSNHLSYRPPASPAGHVGRRRREPAQAALRCRSVSRMKGHEDGGNVLWTGGEERELLLPP